MNYIFFYLLVMIWRQGEEAGRGSIWNWTSKVKGVKEFRTSMDKGFGGSWKLQKFLWASYVYLSFWYYCFFKTSGTDYLIDIHIGPRLDPKATLIQIRIIIKENSPIKTCNVYSPNWHYFSNFIFLCVEKNSLVLRSVTSPTGIQNFRNKNFLKQIVQ